MSDVPEILRPDGHAETDEQSLSSRNSQSQGPTDSHVISKSQSQGEGEGQEPKEISGAGWKQEVEIDEQITPGLENEDLWMLQRRFDKVSRPVGGSLV